MLSCASIVTAPFTPRALARVFGLRPAATAAPSLWRLGVHCARLPLIAFATGIERAHSVLYNTSSART